MNPSSDKYFAGLDVGSTSIKAVIVQNSHIIASSLKPSGGNYKDAANDVMADVLQATGISQSDLSRMVVTGLGSAQSPFKAKVMSDISCHAKGCHMLFPSARTLIDIGGQFSKTAKITSKGRIADFLMSEKCATGSGRFLQVIARILQVPMKTIGDLSLSSDTPVQFSTNCAVFAESETVSRIAEGAKPADILAGVHTAMASKIRMLVKRVGLEPDVVITGGGAADKGLVKAVGTSLGIELKVPKLPRMTAAFGAACLASEII